MKTRLACLAAMAVLPALPSAAQAQSNITLYGVGDAGVEFLTHAPNTATGGSNDVVNVARGSVLSIDLNFVGGTTPTADYTLVLHYLPSAD